MSYAGTSADLLLRTVYMGDYWFRCITERGLVLAEAVSGGFHRQALALLDKGRTVNDLVASLRIADNANALGVKLWPTWSSCAGGPGLVFLSGTFLPNTENQPIAEKIRHAMRPRH